MELTQVKEVTIKERIETKVGHDLGLSLLQDTIREMSLGDFHLSFTSIKEFTKSPLHFLRYKLGREKTDAMLFGSLLHLLILEPTKFNDKYIILTKAKGFEENTWTKSENKAKKARIIVRAEKEGKGIVELDKLEKALNMKDAILSNSVAGDLIRGCTYFEFLIKFKYKGYKWKGFIDGKAPSYLIDLKKVPDADPKKLRWRIKDEMWNMQAFLYKRGAKVGSEFPFYFICYDDNCNVSVIKIDWTDLGLAEAKLEKALDALQDCIISETWNYSYEYFTENGYYASSLL